ncbi:hypothetical protein NI389_09910 [Pseudoalteromonas xiamenensis]|uniref:hypothetical protein n=1 Tax=Pseudoalteromonas xiamenensis TaxID=882626 RepID=UPI0027E3D270|nr:hypothetical protein [Pseudoalteromonas xiamenensis]WMN58573.1 hypothetical protein NI389_09910 [Pseudoalteromonas xiamenensis]
MRFGSQLFALSLGMLPTYVFAHQFYVSYDQSQQTHNVLDTTATVDATGSTLTTSFELNDQWQWSFNVGRASGNEPFNERLSTNLETKHLSSTLSFYQDAWSYSLNVARYRDEVAVLRPDARELFTSSAASPSISIAAQYQFPITNWYFGLDVGLSYGEYEIDSVATKDRNVTTRTEEDSASVTASIGLTASYWIEITQSQSLYLGSSMYWDQVLDSDHSQTQIRATRTPRTRQPATVRRQQFEGGYRDENSGQLSVFVTYGFASDWSLAASYAYPLNSDYSDDAFSVMLGYQF